jgi:polysaccharide pyruvyl transferase CsaB
MKIFLFGYYGFKNLGDELLLIKILEDLQKVVPQAKFYIWTSDPNFTENFLKEFLVKSVYRDNPEDTVSAIKNSDIVILGGGGIIQEYYGINVVDLFRNFGKGVASYAIPPLIGKIFKKKVFYWCLGHSPVITDEAISFSRFFYSLADVITLRDEYSFSTLKELIKEEKTSIYLDVDPLLDLDLSKYLKEPKEKILGVSLRSWFNNKFLIEKVSQALNELLKEDKDLKLFLIPFDLNLDIEIIEALKNYFPSDRLYSFEIKTLEDVIEALSQCKFFLGMRLHSLILAYKLNKPFLTLSYDVKTEEFVNLVNGDFIKTTELNEKELFFKLKKLLVSEPLPLKSFPYKTPLIFEEFIKKNFSLETSKISSISEFLEKEKRYWQDFVKTLMLQRESFYGKIAELETKTKNLETERDRLKVERDELKEERDRLKVERDELKE